jgi:hypothetical protein
MYYIGGIVLAFLIGMGLGAAIWRNNAKKFMKVEAEMKETVKGILAKA